jgi:hypothetical protein
MEPVLFVHGTAHGKAGQVGSLLDELLLDGVPMLMHVSADTRLGFGVGGGIGVETDGFRGTTVGHGSTEDQAGKRYFLVSDGVAGVVLRHRWLHFSVSWEVESRQRFLVRRGSGDAIKNPAAAGC